MSILQHENRRKAAFRNSGGRLPLSIKRLDWDVLSFCFCGWPVEISLWFCVAVCILLLLDRSGSFCWCIAAAAAHEAGHLLMMTVLRCQKCSIRLTGLGIRLVRGQAAECSWKKEFLISLSGPLMNILLFSLLCAVSFRLNGWEQVRVPAQMQLALGIFNLLPVYPLDGGQAVAALLAGVLPTQTAEIVSNVLTALLLLPLFVLGLLVLFRSRENWSLLFLAVYLTVFFLLKKRY